MEIKMKMENTTVRGPLPSGYRPRHKTRLDDIIFRNWGKNPTAVYGHLERRVEQAAKQKGWSPAQANNALLQIESVLYKSSERGYSPFVVADELHELMPQLGMEHL